MKRNFLARISQIFLATTILFNLTTDNKGKEKNTKNYLAYGLDDYKIMDFESEKFIQEVKTVKQIEPNDGLSNNPSNEDDLAKTKIDYMNILDKKIYIRSILDEEKEDDDSLDLNVSNEEKINWILNYWHLTMEEFNILKATCRHEGGDAYIEGYSVINNVFNRTNSRKWAPNENQRNLYNQIIRPSQYSSYLNNYYLQYLDLTPEESPAVQAIIDFLYQEKPIIMHSYRNFHATDDPGTFTYRGDYFYNEMPIEDYLTYDIYYLPFAKLQEIADAGGFANYFKEHNFEDTIETLSEYFNQELPLETDEVLSYGNQEDNLSLVRKPN